MIPISAATDPLLEVRDLQVRIPTRRGDLLAVDGVDLTVGAGEIVGVVGESGSGKTLTAYAIMGLLSAPAVISRGVIRFRGQDLQALAAEERGRMRGSAMSMVFQEPLTALNPVFPVGTQIRDVIRRHTNLSDRSIRGRILELLDHVGIAGPERVAAAYPFELSGGMRQRILIAMAIACGPSLVIADEPTTALDTTIQAQILELLRRLVRDDGISLLLISHDFGIVADLCQRVYVMYAGQVVEHATAGQLFDRPRHPYTSALLGCMPAARDGDAPLDTIEGTVPTVIDPKALCRFADRCGYAQARCTEQSPPRQTFGVVQDALCFRAAELTLPGLVTPSLTDGVLP
ncbi:ABC transporter ATP-binding protein [Mesorhizobium tianshanense]|uniref:ABC transporter ATP-binding protein n=1 Tax=Mesorhizobium tianshanense TaxID=39844 RepID=UPI001391B58C|nr:ABC transporter ATP-binding protein [Mesorhizobium tianshanense]